MGLEIERKFLVKGDFKKGASEALHTVQGYLCSGTGRSVRVRIKGDRGFITIKGPSRDGGLSRFEWEKEISTEDASALLRLAENIIIDKTRYLIPANDGIHTWEVDEFHGENEGLTIAEIELRDPGDTFPKPDWLGEEVTGNPKYYNSFLTKLPFKKW